MNRKVESGRTLRGNEVDQTSIIVGHEHTLSANEPRSAGRKIKHVSLANNRSARSHPGSPGCRSCSPETQSGWGCGLDHAGDYVGARRLGGDNEMNPAAAIWVMRAVALSTSAGAVCIRSASSSMITTMKEMIRNDESSSAHFGLAARLPLLGSEILPFACGPASLLAASFSAGR
jgi:hypothetical protein